MYSLRREGKDPTRWSSGATQAYTISLALYGHFAYSKRPHSCQPGWVGKDHLSPWRKPFPKSAMRH